MDNRTLADMQSEAYEAFTRLKKKCKTYRFRDISQARALRLDLLDKSLEKLGVHFTKAIGFAVDQAQAEQVIDDMLRAAMVQIQNKTQVNDPSMDPTDQGIYIYKNGELVYFISLIYNNVEGDSFDITSNSVI